MYQQKKNTIRQSAIIGFIVINITVCTNVTAAVIYYLKGDDTVIGEMRTEVARFSDTLLDIGRRNGFGYQDMKLLNPDVDTWIPGEGKEVLLPARFILPNVPKKGIVLNIPEMRLYYFPESRAGEEQQVITYPLGIGREGWATPYTRTQIVEKKKDPTWTPPESIRKEHAEKGDILPAVVPAGPDNPLGAYSMRMGLGAYLIHGTNKPYGVGMRVSHGCIRLYPEHIEDLFNRVKIGTPVNIINQPYKIGVLDGVIYLEVHPYLDEDGEHFSQNSLTEVVKYIIETTEQNRYEIDWELVKDVVTEQKGIPIPIGLHLPELKQAAAVNTIENTLVAEKESITESGKKTTVELKLDTEISDK